MVTRLRQHQTKNGKAMGFLTLEDIQGNIELVLFPRVWDQYHSLIKPDAVLVVEGSVDSENGDPKVLVDRITLEELSDVEEEEETLFPSPVNLSQPAMDEAEFTSGDDLDEEQGRPLEEEAGPLHSPLSQGASAWTTIGSTREGNEADDPPLPPEVDDWHLMDPHRCYLVDANADELPVEVDDFTRQTQPPVLTASIREQLLSPSEPMTVMETPYLISHAERLQAATEKGEQPRMLTVVLQQSGQRERDMRRMRHDHGLLVSYPDRDHFAFMIFEFGSFYLVEFPNYTTHITTDLIHKLIQLVGEENIRIEPI